MSNYSEIVKELNEIATKKFAKYVDAKTQYEESERCLSRYKTNISRNDYEMLAEKGRAEATLTEKKGVYEKTVKELRNTDAEINALRRKLSKALDEDFCAKPSALDNNTIVLLNSGILTGNEYEKLIDDAIISGNYTMMRIIAKKAAEMSERAAETKDDELSKKLNFVRRKSIQHSPETYLRAFDELSDIYKRTAENPSMLPRWSELTAPLFEVFENA